MRSLLTLPVLPVLGCLLFFLVLEPPARAVTPTVIHGPVRSPINGHAYFLLSDSTWLEAEAAAVAMGGHLATVRDQFEQKWIFETFRRVNGVARNLWIGLYDPEPSNNSNLPEVRKGEFAWISGEPVTFSQWSANEPSNTLGVEFYAHLWEPGIGVEGYWNDLPAVVPAIYVGRMGAVVEITGPTIQCSDATVFCPDTGPEFTGPPRVIASCSPVTWDSFDSPGPGFDTILRTWIAKDSCGEARCEQLVRVISVFDPEIEKQFSLGGMVAEFTIQVRGFTSASWKFDSEPLGNEAGVRFFQNGRQLALDFAVFRGGSVRSFYNVQAEISTSCASGGGPAGEGGAALPLLSLTRIGAVFDSSPNGDSLLAYENGCGSFGEFSRWVRLAPETDGQLSILLPGASADTRLTVLSGEALRPTEIACGTGVASFAATKGTEYIIGANSASAQKFDCRMVQAPILVVPPSALLTQDTASAALPIMVGDADSDVNLLRLSARSSNPALFDAGSFAFGGQGAARTVILTPIARRSGDATITLRVTDPTGAFSEAALPVSVRPTGPRVRFVRLDTETRGNWRAAYPGFRATIVGVNARLPEIPPVVKGDATWATATRDTRAPEMPDGRPDRVAAAWWANRQMTVRLNLAESTFTRVALYFLDWDRAQHPPRQQRIIVRDPITRVGLSTNDVNEFGNGQYLVLDVRGPVDVEINNTSPARGLNAVLTAILLGEPPASAARLVQLDRATSGNWRRVYGGDGAMIVGVTPRLAALGTVNGKDDWPWARQTNDARALEHPSGVLPRAAWCWFAPRSMTLSLNLPTGTSSRLAAYFVDWDRLGRVQRVEVRARGSNTALTSDELRDFSGGQYLVWEVRGPVDLVISNLSTQPTFNAVLTGLFLGGPLVATAPTPVSLTGRTIPSPNDALPDRLRLLRSGPRFVLEAPGSAGAEPKFETSTDLQHWNPFTPSVGSKGVDESSGEAPARFFRVRPTGNPP